MSEASQGGGGGRASFSYLSIVVQATRVRIVAYIVMVKIVLVEHKCRSQEVDCYTTQKTNQSVCNNK